MPGPCPPSAPRLRPLCDPFELDFIELLELPPPVLALTDDFERMDFGSAEILGDNMPRELEAIKRKAPATSDVLREPPKCPRLRPALPPVDLSLMTDLELPEASVSQLPDAASPSTPKVTYHGFSPLRRDLHLHGVSPGLRDCTSPPSGSSSRCSTRASTPSTDGPWARKSMGCGPDLADLRRALVSIVG
eukprot:gb/GFBE01078278.1/.p1 GENE.gb/GFBE01078278.1/~~gb/GFBE01078278.1/.p1  ORF type:complete len:190 (+),score=36.52 gb/GFBE01078278.1/:1-570(+)